MAGTELCERLATLGLQRNLVLYFTTEMHFSNPESAKMVSNFVGAVYLTPFLGGFAADAYLGRFWAITIFATIQVAVSHISHILPLHFVVGKCLFTVCLVKYESRGQH